MLHPHVYSLMATKSVVPGETTHRSVGGIYWAESDVAAKGQLAADALSEGFAIQILEVKAISADQINMIADYCKHRGLV